MQNTLRDQRNTKGQGKAEMQYMDRENAGVGIVIKRTVVPAIKDIKQISGIIKTITLRSSTGDNYFVCTYAPHRNYDTDLKENYYDQLSDTVVQIQHPCYFTGDMNARLHVVTPSEMDVAGPGCRKRKILSRKPGT
jgi:hypothetical protein